MEHLAESAGAARLSDPLTIRCANQHRETLLAALASQDRLVIELPADAEADISFVQLLIATSLSAHAQGKTIRLKEPASGALADVVARAGVLTAQNSDFWTKGTPSQ